MLSFVYFINLIISVGFKWQRQLIFRTKLTMHTAYDRQDNSEPASITSIAISKYSKSISVDVNELILIIFTLLFNEGIIERSWWAMLVVGFIPGA